jgi:phosphatidylglycerophosphate synthase
MAIHVRILQENTVRLWNLSSRERLERMLKKAGVSVSNEDSSPVAEEDSVLLLRGDFLYDQRILLNMIDNVGVVLETNASGSPRPVAAHVSAELAERMETVLCSDVGCDYPTDLRRESPDTLASAYLKELRKFDSPYLLPISENNRRRLEKRLFAGSYKGVTDLVTKWLWPIPAQWVTRLCARYNIVPNHVTSLSLVLSILAGIMFYYGYYAGGLLSAWLMTFLDTVDGKLARVTINYSAFGNIFDHAIDLIFPPIWYFVWGASLGMVQSGPHGFSMSWVLWLVMAGYIAGRLVEVIFKQGLESSGIFCWQPVDSCFRLITGRRNPNLILLTISLFYGRPDLGLLAVCLWTVLSSLFLITRLITALRTRIKSGPLRSWFLDVDPANDQLSMYQRWFCRRPDVNSGGHD